MPAVRQEKSKLRAREVMLALTAGAVAAGGAALVLELNEDESAVAAATAPVAMSYDGTPFEGLATVGPQNLVVTTGEDHSVRWEGSSEALARLEVAVEDGTLTIRPRRGIPRGFNWSRRDAPTFYITVPRLEWVEVAGSGDVRVGRVEGGAFSGSIAGSGGLNIGALEVDEVDFSIAGSGDVAAAGKARHAKVSIVGSGDLRASGLNSSLATISIVGSGDVDLTVDRQADVSIMGGGDVDIAGAATCSVSRMGGGDVRCGGGTAMSN